MSDQTPIEVAIIGGGCASVAAAFELTRPEHKGKYHVTLYQVGWRLGGKGASGRGPADRIEEHGLHLWMGFYENAFRLLRECYAELNRDPRKHRFADWRDAFAPEPYIGVAEGSPQGRWSKWMSHFPPGEGAPGDPLKDHNPFDISSYLIRSATLLQTLLQDLQETLLKVTEAGQPQDVGSQGSGAERSFPNAMPNIGRLFKYGFLATAAGVTEAVAMLQTAFTNYSNSRAAVVLRLLESIASNLKSQFETAIEQDVEIRRLWEIVDLLLAFQRGAIRFDLINDPAGFDAINDYDTCEWLLLNGASQRSVNSALMHGLYDLAMAYEDGDFRRPGMAAGLGLRACLRMFFTYRGSIMWKMQAGMGDVVFAPFYEVLRNRGVTFRFFHRLKNVKLAKGNGVHPGERDHVEALEFDIQAETKGGKEYDPLIDVRGVPCWPSSPNYDQLIHGDLYKSQRRDFESHWDDRTVGTKVLRVTEDFDFVVLGVGLGAIPHVCSEIVANDHRWRDMVRYVKTVPTQAFQVWMREDMEKLGWKDRPTTISGFVHPFDTWADMRHLIPEESWLVRPRSIAYFCSALPEPRDLRDTLDPSYPLRRKEEVRRDAIRFLNRDVAHIWPGAASSPGQFRWQLLVDPNERESDNSTSTASEERFNSQYWTANVNPSDRYVLSLPGSIKYRISPLDNTYDNLTIAGDWTSCGLNQGCVEAAVISGRLAAHAISSQPALEDIVGYDHP